MRARSIRDRRAQTTGSTHNFEEIVQMCAKNFAHIKKTRRFRREQTIFNELLLAREGDESTKYSQSPCDDDERSARLKAALSYLRKRRYEKSVNEFRSRIWS